MTGVSRKNMAAKKEKSHKQKTILSDKRQSRINVIVLAVVVILAAIPFGLGKYFEFNTPGPFDSGAYVYSAAHILDGAEIGVEEKPSALLGTLLVNILGVWLFGFNEVGPELIQTILQAAALVLMFVSMRKLFGKLAASVGVIIASVYLSSPLIAKFGNVKEQYMIAFMVMGISCFVLYQLDGKWFWAILAGALVSWAPLFKQTGLSAVGAIGLFVIVQPLLKNRSFKQTGRDILLLLAGAAAAIGPLYIWIIAWDVQAALPYSFVWNTIAKMLPAAAEPGQTKAVSSYVAGARKLIPFSTQWPRVLRYYGALILPIALAAGAIAGRLIRMIIRLTGKLEPQNKKDYDRFVLLFTVWWLLDMGFVWISPLSYEQYYLPLNASSAMLGGYLIALYTDKLTKTVVYKTRWRIVGLAGLICMIVMSWHIFFGIEKSPHSGRNYGEKQRGYIQKLNEITSRRKNKYKGPWEIAGEYIRINSEPTDKIYVWGWYPGIYVKAQRFSSAAKAFSMPRPAPQVMEKIVEGLIEEFEKEPPKFIVDSRKLHVPMERPAYVLWPIAPKGVVSKTKPWFLPPNQNLIDEYDMQWAQMLRTRFDEDEAARYEALKPLREYVMKNYEIAEPGYFVPVKDQRLILHRLFGQHILFKLKNPTPTKQEQ